MLTYVSYLTLFLLAFLISTNMIIAPTIMNSTNTLANTTITRLLLLSLLLVLAAPSVDTGTAVVTSGAVDTVSRYNIF